MLTKIKKEDEKDKKAMDIVKEALKASKNENDASANNDLQNISQQQSAEPTDKQPYIAENQEDDDKNSIGFFKRFFARKKK